ncbi:hypothetical protein LU293_09775 [Moraxella nasovis]|uniref:hypothetical protein n=1 Tax=Moraxella nasovis TaxID=2904121 RepID=UPI001F60C817|nr:hypothetical protein [Moraxella nasovis]UNU73335.1 hypothetical protein LU293_09775 [Moraxella nasovis]
MQKTATNYNTAIPTTQEVDLSFAFDDSQNLQAVDMTDDEMKETEGAFVPIVLNLAGRFITSQVAKHHLTNVGLVYGTYTWGKSQGKK